MATTRTGHLDAQQSARLNYLKGSSYSAAPSTVYLGIYASSMPLSDGSAGNEISPATRPAITFGAVAQDANGRHYMTNSSAINSVVLTNTASAEIIGFGVFTASSGGTLLYMDRIYPYQIAAGATVSFPVGSIKIYAEPPTI